MYKTDCKCHVFSLDIDSHHATSWQHRKLAIVYCNSAGNVRLFWKLWQRCQNSLCGSKHYSMVTTGHFTGAHRFVSLGHCWTKSFCDGKTQRFINIQNYMKIWAMSRETLLERQYDIHGDYMSYTNSQIQYNSLFRIPLLLYYSSVY